VLRYWERPKVVFLVPPNAFARDGGWAPEVHEYKGRFYLFTTLHNEKKVIGEHTPFPTFVRGTIVAVSDSPEGLFAMLDKKSPVAPGGFHDSQWHAVRGPGGQAMDGLRSRMGAKA
jgi:hypothetical protein